MWKRLKASRSASSHEALPHRPSEKQSSSAAATQSPVRHSSSSLSDWTLGSEENLSPASPSPLFPRLRTRLSSPNPQAQSANLRTDPLGLVVLHNPPERTLDVIFIHGLGGTSLRTWCHERNIDKLWPKQSLPTELPTARILSFGYNAHFSARGERVSCTIGDFATDLLFRMKYGENTRERLGQVPIVVVAHSMGGLVFKKAFVQGHLNDEFNEVVSMIKAVLFFATPHRGADLAETLNKALSASVFGHSPKHYVAELARRSPTIDELNEAFRHHASKLRIFSFYETLATRIGPVSTMIVDKASAVMGYPGETQTPLSANHHDVCKFTDTDDPNYVPVIGALRSVAESLSGNGDGPSVQDFQHLADLLGVAGSPEEDFNAGRSARKEGTCEGFWASAELNNWLHSESSRVLWVHGPPGGGKSTLCSFVVERIIRAGWHCSYFFFKYRQRNKRSAASMLLSIAYQTALQLPPFREALVSLAKSGERLSNAKPSIIWHTLFSSILAGTRTMDGVLYWVIDALDEADSSKRVVEFITRVGSFEGRVRLLVFSRPLPHIQHEFELARKRIHVVDTPLPNNQDDIRLAVAGEVEHLLARDDFKAEVVNAIAARSQGSFLWASLVTQNVLSCHREDQVQRLLDSTPDGMDHCYDRMWDTVANLIPDRDKALAQLLLTWTMHAIGPITVDELSRIYPAEFSAILDLNHTISQVCGQFVVLDPQGRLTLVHHSAREYLNRAKRQPFTLDAETGNEELLAKCFETLCDGSLRRKLQMLQVPLFLPYAATSWASHLERSSTDSDKVLDMLLTFFRGPCPLAWIQYLAMSGRLSELVGASQRLAAHVRKRTKADAEQHESAPIRRLAGLTLLETWAIELMKLPAKFGRHLSESPASIYQCIPALSPASSIIHQEFMENPAANLSVSGVSNKEWDDCLARVSGGPGRALRLAASLILLAVASEEPRGTITIWDTKLFEEHKAFVLGEHIWALAFNNSGSLLACYSLSTTFVWKVADWSLQVSAENPRQERAIEFKFDQNDALMMISDVQRRVYKLWATGHTESSAAWEQQDPALLDEPGIPEGTYLSTPSCVTFNSDCTQIAVAYHSFPLSIWRVEPPQMIARLRRKSRNAQGSASSYTGDNRIVWHPSGVQIIGITPSIYGPIFKWGLEDDTYEQVKDMAGGFPHGLACSPDGHVFLTANVRGSIKIYDVASMSLIYQLAAEERINQILFSPDGLRFYDICGSYCTIWEPSCLTRVANSASEQVTDTESPAGDFWSDTSSASLPYRVSESRLERRPTITAVEPGRDSHGPLIAYANEFGTVNIYDTVGKKKHDIAKRMYRMTVEKLAWGPKQDLLAYSLVNGATTVKAVRVESTGERLVSTEVLFAEKRSPKEERGRTRQLLFHGSGGRLLVYGTKKCQVFSLLDGAMLAEQCEHQLSEHGDPAQWHQHPSEPEKLLRLTGRSVTVFSWDKLEQEVSIPLDLSRPPAEADDDPSPCTIDAILDSHSPRHLLLRTVTMHQNRPRYDFAVLPTPSIYTLTTPTTSSAPINPIPLPTSLSSTQINAIGILPDDRLVVLDRHLWVCTMTLDAPPSRPGTDPAQMRRHFFLPHDWVTAEGLKLCRVLRDGTVLCPTKGEVAVLKGDLV